MLCPNCASENHKVIKTLKDIVIYRVRQCEKCFTVWNTKESFYLQDTINSENNEDFEQYIKDNKC